VLLDGIARGMHIINGLQRVPQRRRRVRGGSRDRRVTITDVRRPKAKRDLHLFSGGSSMSHVQGRDPGYGRGDREAHHRHLAGPGAERARHQGVMVGTGQTTLIQGGKYGVALDALSPSSARARSSTRSSPRSRVRTRT